jgi:tetratricopeptide (TPR) repeat protein
MAKAMKGKAALLPFPARTDEAEKLMCAAVDRLEAGDTEAEIDLLRAALNLDPQCTSALINLGTAMYNRRAYLEALSLYERATKADPSYALAFFNYANALDELERLPEAIAAYRQALAIAPRYADAHYNLALAYQRSGEKRKAIPHWSRYIKLDPSTVWTAHAHRELRRALKADPLQLV